MTTQPRPTEAQVLAYAQQRLDQAQQNDKSLHPPLPAGETVADLIGNLPASRTRRLYPTRAFLDALTRLRSTPKFLAALHDAHCYGGLITIQDERGQTRDVRCPRCEAERRESRFRTQMLASGIEGRYLDVEWDDLELLPPLDRVARSAQNLAALIDAGASLLLYGELTGTGKTQTAVLIAKSAIRAGLTAHVVNLARLALDVRESYRDRGETALTEKAALLRLTTPDVLVIDDLGAGESDTAAVERRLLFLALDDRQNHRRPTIITTNLMLTPPAGEVKRDPHRAPTLVEVMGARVLARLQPLTPLHVNHGVNFRTRKSEVSW